MDDSCNTGSQPKPFSFRNIPHLMINSFHRLRNGLQQFNEATFGAILSANFFLAIFATLFGSYEHYELVAMLINYMIIVDWVRSIFHYDYRGYSSWLTTLSTKCYTKCKEEARKSVWMPIANAFTRKRNRIERDFKVKLRECAVYLRGFRELLLTSNHRYIYIFFAVVFLFLIAALLLPIVKAIGFFVSGLLCIFIVYAVSVSSTAYIWLYTWFRRVFNYHVEYLTPISWSGVLIFSALLLAFWFQNRFSGSFYSEIDGKQYAIRSSTASNTDRYRRDSQRGRDSTSGNKTKYDFSRRRTTNGESSLRNRGKATTTEEREPVSDNSNEGQ